MTVSAPSSSPWCRTSTRVWLSATWGGCLRRSRGASGRGAVGPRRRRAELAADPEPDGRTQSRPCPPRATEPSAEGRRRRSTSRRPGARTPPAPRTASRACRRRAGRRSAAPAPAPAGTATARAAAATKDSSVLLVLPTRAPIPPTTAAYTSVMNRASDPNTTVLRITRSMSYRRYFRIAAPTATGRARKATPDATWINGESTSHEIRRATPMLSASAMRPGARPRTRAA